MDKSDFAHSSGLHIAIPQGDWDAYRDHIASQVALNEQTHAHAQTSLPSSDEGQAATPQDTAGQPLHGEDDVLAYRRRCARAYIGMNGRLGGRAYRPNEPVILTQEAVQELAELNRLLREERAQKKRTP